MAKKNEVVSVCDGMRKDGTCANGYNSDNHNKPCIGAKCPHKFKYHEVIVEQRNTSAMTNYRDRVSEQYQTVCAKTGEFFREVVKFGALLNEVESFIGESRGGVHDGEGLKGWLSENCPDVNYNTAAGYKAMAAKCARMIGGGTQAIACLQGRDEVIEPGTNDVIDVDESFVEKRNALFEEVDSRRKLEQMWFEFLGASRKPGRPAGSAPVHLKALTETNVVEAMFIDLTKVMDVMCKYKKVLMKNAPAIMAKHPNECADFAQVAWDFAKSFKH